MVNEKKSPNIFLCSVIIFSVSLAALLVFYSEKLEILKNEQIASIIITQVDEVYQDYVNNMLIDLESLESTEKSEFEKLALEKRVYSEHGIVKNSNFAEKDESNYKKIPDNLIRKAINESNGVDLYVDKNDEIYLLTPSLKFQK